MNPYDVRLYSWGKVRCEYTCGEIWVIASSANEAREKILQHWKDPYSIDVDSGDFIYDRDQMGRDGAFIIETDPDVYEIERGLIIQCDGSA